MSELRVYTGSCHCGSVRFRFRSEPIVAGRRCNCSLCVRRGAVMSVRYYGPDEMDEPAGLATLGVYRFREGEVRHYFCRTCGVYPFHDWSGKPQHYRVNLGCVAELDALALAVEVIDGRSF